MIRLSLRVRRADAELVLAELIELAPEGVEEVDDGGETIEYALYGSPGELPELPDLRAAAGRALIDVATAVVPDDWDERWKSFHRPVLIERPQRKDVGAAPDAGRAPERDAGRLPALYVRAPWQPHSELRDAIEVVIEPARAFGTGAHHTTRMTLALLLELAAAGVSGPVLDVGTGSGVLAIAAAKLGFAPVRALDSERGSVQAASENARANDVEVEVVREDIRERPLAVEGTSVVLANLVRPLLLDLADGMQGAPAHLIVSGLLREEADSVTACFRERHQLLERRRLHSGEWTAAWLTQERQGCPAVALKT